MASGAIKEVFAEFGIKVDDAQLEALNRIVDDATQELEHLGSTFGEVGTDALKGGRNVDRAADGMREAEHRAESLAGELSQLASRFLAVAAGGAAIHFLAEVGNESELAARRLGLTVAEIQQLSTVAAESGQDVEEVRDLITTYGERVRDAILEPTSDAAEQLKALGIAVPRSMEDMPSNIELLHQVADAMAGIENPAERGAAASTLLGDVGVRLLPSLEKGAAGIEEMRRRTQELGGGLSGPAAEAIRGITTLFYDMRTVGLTLVSKFVGPFAEAMAGAREKLTQVVGPILEVIEQSNILKGIAAALAIGFAVFGAAALASWIVAAAPALLAVGAFLLLSAAIDDIITAFEGGDALIVRFIDHLFGVGKGAEFFTALRERWNEFVGDFRQSFGIMSDFASDIADAAEKSETLGAALEFIVDLLKELGRLAAEGLASQVRGFFDLATAVPRLVNAFGGEAEAPSFEIPQPPSTLPATPGATPPRSANISSQTEVNMHIDNSATRDEFRRQIENVVQDEMERISRDAVESIEEAASDA